MSVRNQTLLILLNCLLMLAGCSAELSVDELVTDAKTDLEAGRREQAGIKLKSALSREPNHAMAHVLSAKVACDVGNLDQAIEEFSRVSPESPLAIFARTDAGVLAIATHRAVRAEQLLLEAQRLGPANVESAEHLLQLYTLQRRRTEMQKQLAVISQHRPLKVVELIYEVTAGESLVPSNEAIRALERMHAQDASDANSIIALAQCYVEVGRLQEAINLLKSLVAADPHQVHARAILGQILLQIPGSSEEVWDVIHQTKLSSDATSEVWRTTGEYLMTQERFADAAYCFREVVRRNWYDRSGLARLAYTLRRFSQPDSVQAIVNHVSDLAHHRELVENLGRNVAANRDSDELVSQIVESFIELGDIARAQSWAMIIKRSDLRDSRLAEIKKATLGVKASSPWDAISIVDVIPQIGDQRSTDKLPFDQRDQNLSRNTGIRFSDDHQDALLFFQYTSGNSGFKYINESLGGGVGVIDFDGDEWPDLLLTQGAQIDSATAFNSGDQLFRNVDGRSFAAVPVIAGVDDRRSGMGVAVGDLNNDGFEDALVANLGQSSLLLNRGDGTFDEVSNTSGISGSVFTSSIGLADFDHDGDLDIFMVNYVAQLQVCRNSKNQIAPCAPASHRPETDKLFRNLGNGQFEEIGNTAGLAKGGMGLGLILADLDDDGWTDAFVANDTTPNFFYRNLQAQDGILFREEGVSSGLALSPQGNAQAGMGVACRDLNGDSRLDLFVTYFHNEPNGLYLNEGAGLFRDSTVAAGLVEPSLQMLGFGTQAIDADLDGWPELVVANGHIDDQRASNIPWKMRPQLFAIEPNGKFTDRSESSGEYFQHEYLGRGVAHIDWNGDGAPDVVISHLDQPVALLTNKTSPIGNFVQLVFKGRVSNRSAIGAKIVAKIGSREFRQDLTSGDGYACSNSRQVIIGLGAAVKIDRLTVTWPSGHVQTFDEVPAQSRWYSREGDVLVDRIVPLSSR